MRLFVAALIPESVRDALATTQQALQSAAPDRTVRWVAPANYHITLLFLGEQPESQVSAIVAAMQASRRGVSPFRVAVRGIGAFPNWSRPNVLWAGVDDGAEPLTQIAHALERELLSKPAGKPFHPHITLARLKTPCRDADHLRKRLYDATQRLASTEFGRFELQAISLMHSTLAPEGAVYAELERVIL